MGKEEYRASLEQVLRDYPNLIFRDDPMLRKVLGLKPSTLAVMDAKGKGIDGRVFIGRKAYYPKQAVIEFACNRISDHPA